MVNRYLGGTAILAFSVEKSPPNAIPAAKRINGNPRIPAVFIASAKGALAVDNVAICSVGTIPTRNHWNAALTANTINGARNRARGMLICGYLIS